MKSRTFEVVLIAVLTAVIAPATYADHSEYTKCLQAWAGNGIARMGDANACSPHSSLRHVE